MSINPRSRLARILRAIDTALHPIASARRYLARRQHLPRHAFKEAFVLPDAPSSGAEFVTAIPDAYGPAPANYCRTDEWPALTLDELFPLAGEIHVQGEELLDLYDEQHAAEPVPA